MDFFGTGKTMLQTTVDRFCKILPKENIYICTCREHLPIVKEQLPCLTDENILVEPIHRNTAPSVAWANMRILRRNPEANIIVSPSDQLVIDEESFFRSVTVGLGYVSENDVLLAMGVKPTRPEPGYGYIQLGDLSCKPDVYRVKSFTEKPERDFAKMFMESGEFLWNTGMFLANVTYLRDFFLEVIKDMPYRMANLLTMEPEEARQQYVATHYPSYPNLSMDKAALEMSENVFVMQCDFGWADLGTWHAIYECMQKQENDNVVIDSEVMMEDSKGNIIKLPKGHVGVINGLEGYIVAEEGDVLLICKKSDSSSLIRKYVNEIGIRYGEKYT
jgi:mannose-1-phosphate guanylyltransferase